MEDNEEALSNTHLDSTIFKDIEVNLRSFGKFTAIDVNAIGTHAILASRSGLFMVDLEAPYAPAQVFHYKSAWDVLKVKWNPHLSHHHLIASISNQNLLVWDTTNEARPIVAILRAHSSFVTDVAWSPVDPLVLASVSADASVKIWNFDNAKQPLQELTGPFSPGSIISWNPCNPLLIASVHGADVWVWRLSSEFSGGHLFEQATPNTQMEKTVLVTQFTAHDQPLTDMQWSYQRPCEIITCSTDKCTKLWEVQGHTAKCFLILQRHFPVLVSRFTPFGHAFISTSRGFGEQTSVPQAIRLWSLVGHSDTEETMHYGAPDLSQPSTVEGPEMIHSFIGHTSCLLGFAWRCTGPRTFQLVTIDHSQHMRMFRIPHSLMKLCGDKTRGVHTPTPPIRAAPVELTQKLSLGQLKKACLPVLADNKAASMLFLNAHSDLWKEMTELEALIPTYLLKHTALKLICKEVTKKKVNLSLSADVSKFDCKAKSGFKLIMNESKGFAGYDSDAYHTGMMKEIYIEIMFPSGYPNKVSPRFAMSPDPASSDFFESRADIIPFLQKTAENTAKYWVEKGEPCLILCVKELERAFRKCLEDPNFSKSYLADAVLPVFTSISFQGSYSSDPGSSLSRSLDGFTSWKSMKMTLPAPRMCGCSFSAQGKLLTFSSIPMSLLLPSDKSYQRARTYDQLLEQIKAIPKERLSRAASFVESEGSTEPAKIRRHQHHQSSTSDLFEEVEQITSLSELPSTGPAGRRPSRIKLVHSGNELENQSPELLPINHPDHSFSVVNWLAQSDSQFAIFDYSALIPGSVELAQNYLLQLPLNMLIFNQHSSFNLQKCAPPSKLEELSGYAQEQKKMPGEPSLRDSRMASLSSNCLILKPTNTKEKQRPGVLGAQKRNFKVGQRRNKFTSRPVGDEANLRQYSSTSGQEHSYCQRNIALQKDHILEFKQSKLAMVCRYNAAVASEFGEKEITQVWQLIAEAVDVSEGPRKQQAPHSSTSENDTMWLGKKMISHILDHYEKVGDLQMVGTILCVLGGSDHKTGLLPLEPVSKEPQVAVNASSRFFPRMSKEACYLKSYAELLYRWGALEARTEVLKRIEAGPGINTGKEIRVGIEQQCGHCLQFTDSNCCNKCQKFLNCCSVCNLPVRGLSNFCSACKHGGHAQHIQEWFTAQSLCPTGCGCECLSLNKSSKSSNELFAIKKV